MHSCSRMTRAGWRHENCRRICHPHLPFQRFRLSHRLHRGRRPLLPSSTSTQERRHPMKIAGGAVETWKIEVRASLRWAHSGTPPGLSNGCGGIFASGAGHRSGRQRPESGASQNIGGSWSRHVREVQPCGRESVTGTAFKCRHCRRHGLYGLVCRFAGSVPESRVVRCAILGQFVPQSHDGAWAPRQDVEHASRLQLRPKLVSYSNTVSVRSTRSPGIQPGAPLE